MDYCSWQFMVSLQECCQDTLGGDPHNQTPLFNQPGWTWTWQSPPQSQEPVQICRYGRGRIILVSNWVATLSFLYYFTFFSLSSELWLLVPPREGGIEEDRAGARSRKDWAYQDVDLKLRIIFWRVRVEIETIWQEIFMLLDQGRFNQALVEMGKVWLRMLMLMLLQMKSCWWTVWCWKYSNSDTISDIEEELLARPPIWYKLRWQLPEVQRVHLFPSGMSVTFNLYWSTFCFKSRHMQQMVRDRCER